MCLAGVGAMEETRGAQGCAQPAMLPMWGASGLSLPWPAQLSRCFPLSTRSHRPGQWSLGRVVSGNPKPREEQGVELRDRRRGTGTAPLSRPARIKASKWRPTPRHYLKSSCCFLWTFFPAFPPKQHAFKTWRCAAVCHATPFSRVPCSSRG